MLLTDSHMKDRIVSLFKTIGKDFLEVWNQKATVKMFENILKIIGNIMKAVGKLAGQFEKAWKKNDAPPTLQCNQRHSLRVPQGSP